MKIKTLAELKRALVAGFKLQLVGCDRMDHKYMGTIRAVEKQQTNAVKFEGGSWLEFGKAGEYTFYDYGFKQNFGGGFLEYHYVEDQA